MRVHRRGWRNCRPQRVEVEREHGCAQAQLGVSRRLFVVQLSVLLLRLGIKMATRGKVPEESHTGVQLGTARHGSSAAHKQTSTATARIHHIDPPQSALREGKLGHNRVHVPVGEVGSSFLPHAHVGPDPSGLRQSKRGAQWRERGMWRDGMGFKAVTGKRRTWTCSSWVPTASSSTPTGKSMLGNNSAEPAKERFLGQHQAGGSSGMRALSSLRYGLIYRTEARSAGSATHLPRANVESQAGGSAGTVHTGCRGPLRILV